MPNKDDKAELDPRKDGPLHRKEGPIDAGDRDTHNDSIVQPSGGLRTTKPTPGGEVVPGQGSKM